jgi:hypothetical protein
MKKALSLIELLLTIFLCSLLLLLFSHFYLNSSHNYQKFEKDCNDLNDLINNAEEGHYDKSVTQNNNMHLKTISRGKFTVEYLD